MPDPQRPQQQTDPEPNPFATGRQPGLLLELKSVEIEIERARLRDLNASAQLKEAQAKVMEQEAARLEAGAIEARSRAEKEPARQRQALAAGWVRVFLTLIVGLSAIGLAVVGFLVNPLAFVPTFPAALLLYPLRPWEFFSPGEAGDEVPRNSDRP